MKNNIKHLILLLLVSFGSFASATEYVSLTINYSTVGTTEGYDHITKMRVFFDGKEAGESTPKKQTIANSVTVDIPKGSHNIKAVLMAKNEGVWEERTLDNDYSFNCTFENTINFSNNKTIELLFDFTNLKVIETNAKNAVSESYSNISNSTSTENYQTALKKVNDFLKAFDNGYYGYLEVKDGYLYDRFQDGQNYCKIPVKDLGEAVVSEVNRKVSLKCKSDNSCVYSTYTSSNHESLSFSQSSDFNTASLISLLNKLVSALNNKSASTKTKTETNPVTSSNNAAYSTALKKLNDYLKTFDNGYYGFFEVKDGYIYQRFKAGKYNKFKMEDMEGAVIQTQYSRVIFKCKTGNCISTDWKENGKEEYSQFTSGSSYNFQELADLLNNFKDAYLGKKPSVKPVTTTTTTTSTVKTEAQKIREQKDKERLGKTSTKSNDEDLDEDWDAIESAAADLQKAASDYVKESNSKTIAANTKVKLKNVFNKNSNYNEAKKYFGKTGITQSLMTFSGDNYFRGKVKFDDGTIMYFDNAELEIVGNTSNSVTNSGTGNYQTALNNLNEYLKTFNPATYENVEVKDNKVFFNFKVYSLVYYSSINVSDLLQKTTIINAKAIGEFGSNEIKILCKNESKCFYSTYSKDNVDHFRFYSNTVKDLTKMEQLLNAFVNSLK